MTDHSTPTDDELSLALDGKADAALQARIDASPEAQARLEQLRAAATLVSGTPIPPLDAEVVDGLIATAVDTPIAPNQRVAARRGPTPWLVAAAVILLMAVGLSLVWAGRGSEGDQANATFQTVGDSISAESSSEAPEEADAQFTETEAGAQASTGAGKASEAPPGSHGAGTTLVPSTTSGDLPRIYLGSYPDGDALRSATASSLAETWRSSGSIAAYDRSTTAEGPNGTSARGAGDVPSLAAVDRCAEQLRVTLSLKAGPIQTGYALVDGASVLVLEFAAVSSVDGGETTLVAAVGTDACDEVVIFER